MIIFLIIRPFLVGILSAIILAYVFHPWYKKIYKKTRRKNFSAMVVSLLVILIITIPLIFAINAISREAYVFYITTKQKISTGELVTSECYSGRICSLSNYLKNALADPKIKFYLESALKKTTDYIVGKISDIPQRLALIGLNAFVVIFIMFYLFRDGEKAVKIVKGAVPIKKDHKEKIMNQFNDTVYAVIYGSIITALIQGAVGALGFFIFGIHSPLLWGGVMVIAALIPFIGTPVVWLPAGLLQIISGYVAGDALTVGKGIGLVLYGALIISSIDNLVKPKLIGDKANVHPTVILVGVLGGLHLFGLVGFILGPLILSLSFAFLKLYRQEMM